MRTFANFLIQAIFLGITFILIDYIQEHAKAIWIVPVIFGYGYLRIALYLAIRESEEEEQMDNIKQKAIDMLDDYIQQKATKN